MSQREIIIAPGSSTGAYLADLWSHRELFYQLAWRDISVRYKQAVFGLAWAVARPVLTMLVMAVVFGRVASLPSEGVPYPLWVLGAMLFWQFFAGILGGAAESLVANANMVSKVYFPRVLVPLASLGVNSLDLVLGGVVMAGLMAWYGVVPGWQVLLLPLLALWCAALALGAGLWLAALNVRYRDVKHALPFVIQFGLYASPVGFGLSAVPQAFQGWILWNPLSGILEAVRWCLFGVQAPGLGTALLVSAAWTLGLGLSGLAYFRATERGFADVI